MYTNNAENTNDHIIPPRRNRWPIHPVVMNVIGLTVNERKVLDAVRTFQCGRDVSKLAKVAGIARTTTLYTLKKLEKRGLVFKTLHNKVYWWRYKRGLEFMRRVQGSEIRINPEKINFKDGDGGV